MQKIKICFMPQCRKLLFGCLLAISITGVLASWSVSVFAVTTVLDSVVAIVDNDVVMDSELQRRLTLVVKNYKDAKAAIPSEAEVRRQVLDRMIVDNLQMQMAERASVHIDDNMLNQTMSGIARQNGMDLANFKQKIEADGGSYRAIREQIRHDLILQQVQRGNVYHRVTISEEEVSNFLESDEGQLLTSADYHVDHILLPLAASASGDEVERAKKFMQGLKKRAEGNEQFSKLAEAYVGFKLNHSDLGWRKQAQLPGIFTEAVVALDVGQVAEPIRSPSGLHLIKLAERRGGEKQMIAQTQARHILLKTSELRNDEQTRIAAEALSMQLRAGADFFELAKQHSEDIGSAMQGGDLGWMNPGDLVPEFEAVMNGSDIDEVSAEFKSQFGWHILQVVARRDHDVTELVLRNRVRRVIHQRKYDEELEIWLQKIRDEAYVDIKY